MTARAIFFVPAIAVSISATAGGLQTTPPLVGSSVYATFERSGALTELIGLAVGDVIGGTKVTINCSGPSCSFSSRTISVEGKAKILALTDLFLDTKFKPGTILEIRLTKSGSTGKLFAYEIQSSNDPKVTKGCLPPGSDKMTRC